MVSLSANCAAAKSLKAQLMELNAGWAKQNCAVVSDAPGILNETELIRTHLLYVEAALRSSTSPALSLKTRERRMRCLDILHSYALRGQFPINLHHRDRTPYFIDHLGTACAVGQLMIETGFVSVAKKISTENNNGYIRDLDLIYPELSEWARTNGFRLEELAWIQPCYCRTTGAATLQVSCKGSSDGYFMPDTSDLPHPVQLSMYKWNGAAWDLFYGMCVPCDLPAGEYKAVAKDGLGDEHEFFATLVELSSPEISLNVAGDWLSCNATATTNITGGFPPYIISWPEAVVSNSTASGLCEKWYRVTVKDSLGCYREDLFAVGDPEPLGFDESSETDFKCFSPDGKVLYVRGAPVGGTINICDFDGRLLRKVENVKSDFEVPVHDLAKGVLFVTIVSDSKRVTKKILIQ